MRKFLLLLLLSASVYAAPDPWQSCDAATPCFENITASVIDQAPPITQHFGAFAPDFNYDGCFDLYVGAHADIIDSALFMQNNQGGKCLGTWRYVPDQNNYSQAEPRAVRITGGYKFGNWYQHPLGFASYIGTDVDQANSAKYVATGMDESGNPLFAPKSVGCRGSRVACTPININGDGVIEFMYQCSTPNKEDECGGMIKDADGNILEIPDQLTALPYANGMIPFDVDNDGAPEFVVACLGGYYKYINQELIWQTDKLPITGINCFAGSNHALVFDYDNDGDSDLLFNYGTYSTNTTVPRVVEGPNRFYTNLFKNNGDGTFSDATLAAGLVPDLIKNTVFWTTYCNSWASDLNNDGNIDVLIACEAYEKRTRNGITTDAIVTLRNMGDGTFTADRSQEWGVFRNTTTTGSGKGSVFVVDLTGDGKEDVVKTHGATGQHESIALFKNVMTTDNTWLNLHVQGPTTECLHCRVIAKDVDTGQIVTSVEMGQFNRYNTLTPHLGLGDRKTVDLEIHRENGTVYPFNDVPTNQHLVVHANGVMRAYIPGADLLAIPAVEPPDEEIPDEEIPDEDPDLSDLEKAQAKIAELETTIEQLQADKIALSKANIDQANDIAGLNVNLVMAEERLSRAEAAKVALESQITNLTRPITIRVTETGVVVGE